jgi:formylglycine-generating enzyme required for sulfatase activity
MVPGSLVFYAPVKPVMLNDFSQWWQWGPHADWRHPQGHESDIEGKGNHPVVHIAYEDAIAYCKWKGRRLPTEAEWEYASRAGKETNSSVEANKPNAQGKFMANTYQGSFPVTNLIEDGFERTSPVKTFSANDYGLYDMIGNVWEWTSDYYDINYYVTLAKKSITINPKGPKQPFDPNEPFATKRVTKGGSFLCASNYCSNYRSTARQATSVDSGSSNIGFRTVVDSKN